MGSYDVLFAAGSVWVTNNNEKHGLARLARHQPGRQDDLGPGRSRRPRVRGGTVWVGTLFSPNVYRIDPATNRTTKVAIGTNTPVWFSGDANTLWVSNGQEGTATRIDVASGKALTTVKTGQQPVDGTIAPDGLVWIPNLKDGRSRASTRRRARSSARCTWAEARSC
jgi:streptogramin lyase